MQKYFNISGICVPEKHYMVDILPKIEKITEEYIEPGYYFTINHGQLYGKTTILHQLSKQLQDRYLIIGITFIHVAYKMFECEEEFIREFAQLVSTTLECQELESVFTKDWNLYDKRDLSFEKLFERFYRIYTLTNKEIILVIDGIDRRADNQYFLKLLELLQNNRFFHNVILAGIYDMTKLWNNVKSFDVDMSFSSKEIASMLDVYEKDHNYGIDIEKISNEIYAYTSGHPYLVSQICKLMDESIWENEEFGDKSSVWCLEGIKAAVEIILEMNNNDMLFYSIKDNLHLYPDLYDMISHMLLDGNSYSFSHANNTIQLGVMLDYFKEQEHKVAIANRIFKLYLLNICELYNR